MVRETFEPGKTVLMVARKLRQDNSLSAVAAGEKVVPASKLSDALKQIRELQRLLGKKTMENEIFREAVEVMKSRKWIARSPSLPGDGQ
jgi:transposase